MKRAVVKNSQYLQESCRPAILLKTDSNTGVFEIFKNTYFEEHLLTAASDLLKQLQNSSEHLLPYENLTISLPS